MTTLIEQKTTYDCGIACLAMALNLSYDDVMGVFPEQRMNELVAKGMSNEMYAELMTTLGVINDVDYTTRHYGHHWFTYRAFKNMLWGRRAICAVRSKNVSEGFHFVYWDGFKINDPSTKDKYTDDDWTSWAEPYRVYLFNECARPVV